MMTLEIAQDHVGLSPSVYESQHRHDDTRDDQQAIDVGLLLSGRLWQVVSAHDV